MKYLNASLSNDESGVSVINETLKLEQVSILKRMYIAVMPGNCGRLIIKGNGDTLLDAIVSPSKKQQVIEFNKSFERNLKLEFLFLSFKAFEPTVPPNEREEGEEVVFSINKLVSMLLLVN